MYRLCFRVEHAALCLPSDLSPSREPLALDSTPHIQVEKERGITVKAHTATLFCQLLSYPASCRPVRPKPQTLTPTHQTRQGGERAGGHGEGTHRHLILATAAPDAKPHTLSQHQTQDPTPC